MHYYKRNIGDYHRKAGRLSMLEHGSYTLLIDACYDRESFPTLDEAIDWCWARNDDEITAVKFVLSKFFKLNDEGRYEQTHIKEDLENYRLMGAKNAEIAQRREEAKRAKREPINHEPSTLRDENSTEREPSVAKTAPNQEPLTNNKNTPVSESESAGDELPAVCVVLRGLGVSIAEQRKNLDKITALVHRGAGLEHFTAGLEVAKEAGKGFDYSLGVVKRRLDDAELPTKARASPSKLKSKHDLSGIDYGAGLSTDGRM